MKVTFSINVTPTPAMMLQAHLLARSIDLQFKSNYEIVLVWDHNYEYDAVVQLYPWLLSYPHRVVKTPSGHNEALGYVGNFLHRFEIEYDGDMVVLMDADTVVTGSLDAILRFGREENAILGVTAGTLINELFAKCFAACGVSTHYLPLEFPYWGVWKDEPDNRFVPPQYNCGVLVATPGVFAAIGKSIFADTLKSKAAASNHPLYTQIGVAMAMLRSGVRYHGVHMRYNLAAHNGPKASASADPAARIRHAVLMEAFGDPRVAHYCVKSDALEKKRDFSSYSALQAFADRDVGYNRLAQILQRFARAQLPHLLNEARIQTPAAAQA